MAENSGKRPPRITVIMGAYNAEASLGRAVESILGQSWRDLEFIICDDGSTDGSWELLQGCAAADERIRLLRSGRNLGAGAARNRCLAQAGGEYVALMDADDISLPERLAREKEALDRQPALDFVGTRGVYSADGRAGGDGYWFLPRPEKKDFLMTLPFVHASLMFRRRVLQALGGYGETPVLRRAEDYDLLMRAYAAGFRGMNLPETLYLIRPGALLQRQTYTDRLRESVVKWRGFTRLGLMPRGIAYAMKPLAMSLLPPAVLLPVKQRYYSERERTDGI